MYPSIVERIHDMQQTRTYACVRLPANHPLQPPMIEPIQFGPTDAEGAVDHTGSESANIDVSSSHPNSPTQTTETHEPSISQGLINHYSGELPDYESNLEKASDIASTEVMTESPHQQTPNQEMASSTNTYFVLIPDHIHPEPDAPEQDVPELSIPEHVISNQSPTTNTIVEPEITTNDQLLPPT